MNLKRIILYFVMLAAVFFGFGVIASHVQAQDITLEWNANTEPNLTGYNVYQAIVTGDAEAGTHTSAAWEKIATVAKDVTEYTAVGLDNFKAYSFQVTAINDEGNESFVSNMAATSNLPARPPNLRITVIVNQ